MTKPTYGVGEIAALTGRPTYCVRTAVDRLAREGHPISRVGRARIIPAELLPILTARLIAAAIGGPRTRRKRTEAAQ